MSNAAYFQSATAGGNFYRRWKQGETCTINDYGSMSEISIVFLVAKYSSDGVDQGPIDFNGSDGSGAAAAVDSMLALGVVPFSGATYSSDWSSTSNPNTVKMRCRTVEYEQIVGQKLKVTVHFTGYYSKHFSAAVELLPASIELQSSMRSMTVYRRNPSTGPSLTLDISAADIGGDPMATYGIFGTVQVPQMRIRVRLIRDAIVNNISAISTKMQTILNTKNSNTFFGYSAGSLICDGASMIHLGGNYYEVIFDLLYDSYNHHEQVPLYMADGSIDISTDGVNAKEVKWKRYTREAVDFDTVWFGETSGTGNLKDTTLKGYWSTY